MVINPGVQVRLLKEAPTAAGNRTVEGVIQSDALLVTLFAESVSGTLDVEVYAVAGDNQGAETLLFSFPQVAAPTSNLLLKRSSISMARFRIKVIYSAACSYDLHLRAVSAGTSDVRIIGSSAATAHREVVGLAAAVLIPAPILDRQGIVIKNNSLLDTIYIGFTAAEATNAGGGWPMSPGEQVGMDLSSGVAVYASSTGAATDVRIMEAGG